MLDFVFIITIILELVLTSTIVVKICELEKKVKQINEELLLIRDIILEINSEFKRVISNINKVVSVFTNKKFITISKVISLIIDTIQVIILIHSLNLSKGIKSINFKTVKKLFMAQITKTILQRLSGCSF